MSRDQKLKEDYDKILDILAAKFGDGEKLNVVAIIYLIANFYNI